MDPNKDREVQAAFDGYMSFKDVAELMVVREAAARKEAFLEAAGIAEKVAIEVSGTGWADAKARADSVRAVERHLRAKAAE